MALELIDKSLNRGYRPGIVLIDSGYANNTNFLKNLEKRKLNYLGGLAKNRKVKVINSQELTEKIRLDTLAQSLPAKAYRQITINLEKSRTVWVATIEVEISRLEGSRKIAIVMNAPNFKDADDMDYFITNVEPSIVTPQWVVDTYSPRNWVERLESHLVFYREAKGWLGLKEYQTMRKAIASLVEKRILLKEHLFKEHHGNNFAPKNRTFYYNVNYARLEELAVRHAEPVSASEITALAEERETAETTENLRFVSPTEQFCENSEKQFCNTAKNKANSTSIKNDSKDLSHPHRPCVCETEKEISQEQEFSNPKPSETEEIDSVNSKAIEKDTNASCVEQ